MKFNLFFTAFCFQILFANAQSTHLILNPNIELPQDSLESKELTSKLDDFLQLAQKPNEDNHLVFPPEKVETFILLDEVNGIQKSGRYKDDFFYKPYLTNVVAIENNAYLIKVSYIGVNEKTPILCGSFEFIAHKSGNSFLFSSPIIRNTRNWKTTSIGNNTFHYENTINETKVKEFGKLASEFDEKLKASNKECVFYLCADFVELQKLIGVDYKLEYNGASQNTMSSSVGNKKLVVFGSNSANFNEFDPHDLWHDRLSLVIPRRAVNKPIDEGCAYLYGGSWGMSWAEILKRFKTTVATSQQIDWANYKENPVNFGESQAKHLLVDYVVNALLVQKIEKEKGFDGVWAFLNCGPSQKGNENYYSVLEKLTGITKASYNSKISELINNQK